MTTRRGRVRFAPNVTVRAPATKIEENTAVKPVKTPEDSGKTQQLQETEKEIPLETTEVITENKSIKSPLIENDLNVIQNLEKSPAKSRTRFTRVRPNLGVSRRFTPTTTRAEEEPHTPKRIPAQRFNFPEVAPVEPSAINDVIEAQNSPHVAIEEAVETVVDSVVENRSLVVQTLPKTAAASSKPKSNRDGKVLKSVRISGEKKTGPRRHFNGKTKEPPERSQMTMFDLIYYNPSSNPMTEKESEAQKSNGTVVGTIDENEAVEDNDGDEEEDDAIPVPQVKLAADGSIVVDEQSLLIETTASKKGIDKGPVTYENSTSSTYSSFRRPRNGKYWDPEETRLFYKVLNRVGTDFSMMTTFFPNRTRHELKLKFNREDKLHKELVDKAINEPQRFDTSALEELLEQQENDEARATRTKTKSRGRGRGRGGNRGARRGGQGKRVLGKDKKRKCVFVSEDESDEDAIEDIINLEKETDENELIDDPEDLESFMEIEETDTIWSNKPTRSGRQPKKPKMFRVPQEISRRNKIITSVEESSIICNPVIGTPPNVQIPLISSPPAVHTPTVATAQLNQTAGGSLVFVPSQKSDLNTQVIHIYRISPLPQQSLQNISASSSTTGDSFPVVLPLNSPIVPGQQFILAPTLTPGNSSTSAVIVSSETQQGTVTVEMGNVSIEDAPKT